MTKLYFLLCLYFYTMILSAQELSSLSDSTALSKLSYDELDSIIDVFYNKGDYMSTFPYVHGKINKAKLEFGEMDSVYAISIQELGFYYGQLGEYKKAEPLYLKAIDIIKEVKGDANKTYAHLL